MTPTLETMMRRMRRVLLVPRWQLAPIRDRESVMDHSVTVLYIAKWLRKHVATNPELTAEEIWYILEHDSDEAVHGDAPSTSKVGSDPAKCVVEKRALLKTADYLESMVYLTEEAGHGNTYLTSYFHDTRRRAVEWFTVWKNLAGVEYMSFDWVWTELQHVYAMSKHPNMIETGHQNG